jgi:hypothetical protein
MANLGGAASSSPLGAVRRWDRTACRLSAGDSLRLRRTLGPDEVLAAIVDGVSLPWCIASRDQPARRRARRFAKYDVTQMTSDLSVPMSAASIRAG